MTVKLPKKIQLPTSKALQLAILLTVPTLVVWGSALVTYVWVTYISYFLTTIPSNFQTFIFLGLPIIGLITSIIAHRSKPTKLTKTLIVCNAIFIGLVIIASFRQT